MSDTSQSPPIPHFILTVDDGAIHGENTSENREIVRRIYACVNACEGISTEELERGIIQDMRNAISQVVPLLQSMNQAEPQSQPNS